MRGGAIEQRRNPVSAHDLVTAIRQRGGCSDPGGSVGDLPARLQRLRRPDDLVLVLGAGDIDKALEGILAAL